MAKSKKTRFDYLTKPKVIALDSERRLRRSEVVEGTDENGNRYLNIFFLSSGSRAPTQIINATNWLSYPRLAKPIAEAFVAAYTDKAVRTRGDAAGMINSGIIAYLDHISAAKIFGLEDFSCVWVNGFISWLSRSKNGKPVLMPKTRQGYLSVLRTLIEAIRRTDLKKQLPRTLKIPLRAWPGISRTGTPTKTIDIPTFLSIIEAARSEAQKTIDLFTRGRTAIEAVRSQRAANSANPLAYRNLWVCLAEFENAFSDSVPSLEPLRDRNPRLFYWFKRHGGMRRLGGYLAPTPRQLVPFVLLLGIYTFFNPGVLLGLETDNWEFVEVLGTQRIRFQRYKGRAYRDQIRSFPLGMPVGPDTIVKFIVEWTSKIRPYTEPVYRKRLFLYVPTAGSHIERYAKSYHLAKSEPAWAEQLTSFCRDHNMCQFTLAQIRTTGLDFSYDILGGDLRALQALGGQRSPDTIRNHYLSDSARKRNDDDLSSVMATRERWIRSSSKIDPRDLPGGVDLGAATPPFRCFDPYDSPVHGEQPGRICGAYGACPTCPMAHVQKNDPYTLARLLQLKAKIEEAQHQMDSLRWIAAWAPRLSKLNEYWLPQFSNPSVVNEAKRLCLPRLPDLE
ncbi:MAG: hypothetical protein HYR80_09120 [Nitrospirae bacterium]|nr:hypothetical protein [Nitrospirota bacterium]